MELEIAAAALVGLAARGVLPAAVLRDGRIVWASAGFLANFRLSGTDVLGRRFLELVAPEDHGALASALNEAPGTHVATQPMHGLRPDGSRFDAELTGAAINLPGGAGEVIIVRDVTEQRRTESRLSELAFVDPLTELPNRALFLDRLHQALVDARRYGSSFAVLMGDLDGFKQVNDRFGHETGDALLQVVAKRLRSAMREGDTLARVGGDEFAALLPRAADRQEATLVARRIISALDAPIVVAGQHCDVGFSAGIALFPANGRDIDALLAHADGAMYVAKRAGGRRFEFALEHRADITGPLRLPVFEWQEGYVLGVALMDEEHQKLATLINRLAQEFKSGQDNTKLTEALRNLIRAVRAHLTHEEWLLANAGVGEVTEEQKREQRALIEELERRGGSDGNSMALTLRYLNGWLSRHIEWNRLQASQLQERGLSL